MGGRLWHFLFVKLRRLKYQLLSNNSQISGVAQLLQPTLFQGKGKIQFGLDVQIGVPSSPFYYNGYTYIESRNPDSKIQIGNGVSFNNNTQIIAFSSIEIKDKVLIGCECLITDNDAHGISPESRHIEPESQAVIIEENVWIGDRVTILKGVRIGKNSVIGAGSVVTDSIPDNVIAAGIPARTIKNL